MKKAVWSGIIATVGRPRVVDLGLCTADGARTVTANVNAEAKVSINGGSTASISFADVEPDVSGTIAASDVKARTTGNGGVTLTVRASQDLRPGLDIIAISDLKWSSTGANIAPTLTAP
jgi:hypothetical protein